MIVLPPGVERIYHYHVRKTAGSSLSRAFRLLAKAQRADPHNADTPFERNRLVFVGNDRAAIARGDWFFGTSHIPAHRLDMPPGTFTVTVLRDPLRRFVSYFQYLHFLDTTGTRDNTPEWEREATRGGFADFVARVPEEHRQRQLFMFSRSFSVDQAFATASRVDAVLFTEDFADGVERLGQRLELDLPVCEERRFPHLAVIDPGDVDAAREVFRAEQAFIDAMRTGVPPQAPDLRSEPTVMDEVKVRQLIDLASEPVTHALSRGTRGGPERPEVPGGGVSRVDQAARHTK